MNSMVFIKGRVSLRDEEPKVIAQELIPLEEVSSRYTSCVVIKLFTAGLEEETLEALKKILRKHQGKVPVYLNFAPAQGEQTQVLVERPLYVKPSQDLTLEIEKLLGEGTVKFGI